VQTRKVTEFPVVLWRSAYWEGLFDWLRERALEEGNISSIDLDLVTICDDVDDVVNVIVEARRRHHEDDAGAPK
jgi:predicted Rossmann-fold nucleotide-binding protein